VEDGAVDLCEVEGLLVVVGLEGEEATSALEEEVNTMNSKEVDWVRQDLQ